MNELSGSKHQEVSLLTQDLENIGVLEIELGTTTKKKT